MQAQALMHYALLGRAHGVFAALERPNPFSWISLDGGGNRANTASGVHRALPYTPLCNGQALPYLYHAFLLKK